MDSPNISPPIQDMSKPKPSPGGLSFDEHMKKYQKGAQEDFDRKPSSSPTYFNVDGFAPSNFFRPPVWTGAGNVADGLLGCQAPAADGLDETFTIYPESTHQPILAHPISIPKSRGKKTSGLLPRFPTEIHLQILTHVLESSQVRSCSFCHLFELSNLSKVSILYHMLLEPHLYRTLHLNFNSSSSNFKTSLINRADQREICEAHIRLASKHQQLEERVPLLLRTLSSRRDLAEGVRKIILPPGGTKTFLTCALEKTHLPALIRRCSNLEDIEGVDSLLLRQFFSGEHYCLDGQDPQQHGALALALHESKTLRHWCWTDGNAGGCDLWSRLWDYHPSMEHVNFVDTHRNWTRLEALELRNVWNLDISMLTTLLSPMRSLRKVTLVGLRKKRVGRGDAQLILATLSLLPASVKHLELGNTADDAFLGAVGEWVRVRHTVREFSMLEALRITQTPITTESLRSFLDAVVTQKVSGTFLRAAYLPLLDFRPCWLSVVRRLALDNDGFGKLWGLMEVHERFEGVGSMELHGLEELEWRVSAEEGGDAGYLSARLRRGWFAGLKCLGGVQGEADVVAAAVDRKIRVI